MFLKLRQLEKSWFCWVTKSLAECFSDQMITLFDGFALNKTLNFKHTFSEFGITITIKKLCKLFIIFSNKNTKIHKAASFFDNKNK